MADMTDDQLKRYFQRPDFDSKVLTPDEKTRLVQLTSPGSTGGPEVAKAPDDSPLNFAKEFTGGAGEMLKENFGGILKGFQAVPDVVRDVINPATAPATMKGMGEGMKEGVGNLVSTFTDPISMATGIGRQPEGKSFGNRVGRMAVGAAMVGVPAALGDRVMNGAPPEPSILKGAEQFRDVESRGPKVSAPEQAARTPMVHGDVAPTEHFQPSLEMQPFEGRGTTPTLPIDASGPLKAEVPAGLLEHQEPVAEKTVGVTSTPTTAPPDRNLGSMSPQDHMFESLMEQLHPEADGPLPGNGGFKDLRAQDLEKWRTAPKLGTGDGNDYIASDWSQQNLSKSEQEAVAEYLDGFGDEQTTPLPDDILSKLPKKRGNFYRGVRSLQNEVPPLPGSEFTTDRMRSATENPGLASDYADTGLGDSPGVIKYRGVDVHDIEATHDTGKLSPHGPDREVLVPGGASLAVEDVRGPKGMRQVTVGPNEQQNFDEVRDEVGAQEAARDPRIMAAFKEAGIKPTADAIRDMSGTPSREPLEKSNRLLDNDFMRHIMDERGSIQFGPTWKSIKEKLGFGAEPTAIKEDPFAMQDGPMGRRQFLYRSSGAPKALAGKVIKEFADGGPKLPEKESGRLRKLLDVRDNADNLSDERSDTLYNSIGKYTKDVFGTANDQADKVDALARRHFKGKFDPDEYDTKFEDAVRDKALEMTDSGNHPLTTLSSDRDEYEHAWELADKQARAKMVTQSRDRVPSILETLSGETRDEFGKGTNEPTAEPKSLDDAVGQMSVLDRLKKFREKMRDEQGSAQVVPDWLTKKNKVIAGDPSYTGDVKSMIQSDNIRQGKGSGEDWVNQTVTDRLKKLRSSEEGFVGGDVFKSAGRVANQARVASFLSGLAVPKSLLGNAGAIVTAAVENGDFNIVKEAFNLKANAQSLKDAWQSTANPAAISGAGKINIPGRVMGAADQATIDLLKRAGLSEDDAQRLQLQRPNPVGDNNFGKALKSPVGKFVWPFQRTPFNQLAEGISSENWKSPHAGDTAGTARRTGLSLAAGGAGYELGQNTKDPRILGLAAAMAGVRGVPLLIGAAMGGAGKNAIAGISPIPEWGIPSKASDLARLTGLDPAFIKAYGLDDTSKRKDRSSRPTTSRSSR